MIGQKKELQDTGEIEEKEQQQEEVNVDQQLSSEQILENKRNNFLDSLTPEQLNVYSELQNTEADIEHSKKYKDLSNHISEIVPELNENQKGFIDALSKYSQSKDATELVNSIVQHARHSKAKQSFPSNSQNTVKRSFNSIQKNTTQAPPQKKQVKLSQNSQQQQPNITSREISMQKWNGLFSKFDRD